MNKSPRDAYEFLVQFVMDHASTLAPMDRARLYRGLAEIVPDPGHQGELRLLASDIETAERRHYELKLKIVAEC